MINIYVAFYSWLTPSIAMNSSIPPPRLRIINPFWRGAEVPFPESQWNMGSNSSVLTQKFMNFPWQHTASHRPSPIIFSDSPRTSICNWGKGLSRA